MGLREGAPKDQVKKVYISLTKKYHPDVAKDEESKAENAEKFLQITEAYEAITKKGGNEEDLGEDNLSRRDRQAVAIREARQRSAEKHKWKGLEENKKALFITKSLRYFVLAGVLFNLLILVGATEEITRYYKIGEIYEEDEKIDECVDRASQAYQQQLQNNNDDASKTT